MRRRLAVLWSLLVVTAVGVASAPPASAADLPPGDYLWVTTTTQTLVYDRSQQPTPPLVAQIDDSPTGAPVRVVNQGGAVILVPTATGIDSIQERTAQKVLTYTASPNGYQQVVASRGDYAATTPTVYGLRTGGRVIDVWQGNGSLVTSITLPGPTTSMSAPRPPNHDVIVLGSVKNDNNGGYLSAVINTADNTVAYSNAGTRQLVNGAVWSPDGSRAYLSARNLDSSTGTIVTFSPSSGFQNHPMAAGVTPQQVGISLDGSRLYVPAVSGSDTTLQVVDTGTFAAFSVPFEAAVGAGAPSYSPDGKVYIAPGAQAVPGSVPFYDIRGAVGVLQAGGASPVIGTLVADLPKTVRVVSGQNQQAYVGSTPLANPVVVEVLDPAGNPLPDQLVRFIDDDAGVRFTDCAICLTYTGPDGRSTSSPLLTDTTVGPAHILVMVDGVPTVTVPFTVLPPPVPPTITSLTGGDGQVAVAFTPGDDRGISPPTGFTVTATDITTPAHGGQTATGAGSPIAVTGLTNGDTYTFTVTANTPSGNWTSAPSQRLAVGIPASITGTPPPGEVGKPYRFQFTVTGTPTPTVALSVGTPLPDGLSFDAATATISGTPTTAGPTFLLFTATNALASAQNTPTLIINPADSLGSGAPPPTTAPPTTTPPPTTSPASTSVTAPPPSGYAASSRTGVSYATASGSLAATGQPVEQLVGAGLALVLTGALVLVLRRRALRDPQPARAVPRTVGGAG